MSSVRRVAVIGAGASGLATTKSCLEEDLEPVCFERRDDVGGLWYYTEKINDGQGCVMKSTITNSSKEFNAFSDYPMPKEYPNFTHNRLVQKYFRSYADNFGLDRYIRYNTEVTKVKKATDYDLTGQWIVDTNDHKTGHSRSETFDAVLVCSGHHGDKNMPSFPGLEQFEGPVIHSHDYRYSDSYRDKKALVIGLGNSAGDIACELTSGAEQVYLSTRSGAWVECSTLVNGLPWDLDVITRWEDWKSAVLPFKWTTAKLAAKFNRIMDHDLFSLKTDVMPSCHSPFLNDDLKSRLLGGRVKVKDDIKRFTPKGVEFKDGTYEDVDVVFMATGYIIGFPFIDKEILDVKDNQLMLYKQMFVPELKHQTLVLIGCVQPNAAIWPICELQSRLATRVVKGVVSLPSEREMWQEMRLQRDQRLERYPNTLRHTLELDWIPYMDDLARIVGCKPRIGRLLLTDPRLAVRVVFGPCYPYHYRLHGPRSWPGARQAILTAMDRVRFPLQTRAVPHNQLDPWMAVADWVLFPPSSYVVFLEVVVVVCFLLLLLG